MINLRRSVLTALAVVATFGAYPASASDLALIGVGWATPSGQPRPTVTYLIKPAGGVTLAAIADVQTALNDWHAALLSVPGAPNLIEAPSGAKSADIVIQMKIGGGRTLGSARLSTASPFSCALKSVSIQLSGKAFGQTFSDAGTRNVARSELGHAFGLGHTDDPNDVMSPTADPFTGTDILISGCDKKGIDAIYPLPSDCSIPGSVSCP
jgi:hypothetical protein